MNLTYIKLKSSLLKACMYNQAEEELVIVFNNDAMYTYQQVTTEEYTNFIEAESQGSYFAKNIKGKKNFQKIDDEQN